MKLILILTVISNIILSCSHQNTEDINSTENEDSTAENTQILYRGADLSYVNEMEDCHAVYRDSDGEIQDPYLIFKEAGANLIRVRLWHNPDWTNYSNIDDVKKTIKRAKDHELQVLLDFHYSDTWADPSKQEIPAAWENQINNTKVLEDSIYNYTYEVLDNLSISGLLPDMVQVGNETNGMILQKGELKWPIDWDRNSALLNKGIKAVRDFSTKEEKVIEVMIHIAQPENGLWWFEQAFQNNVTDFDWIGLSYYPIWSDYTLDNVSEAFTTLIQTYKKRLMVVETAYPFTMQNADDAANILGEEALISGYPATQEGQLNYLNKLKEAIKISGGEGLIYWEPAWVSTGCNTLWAKGSHWDNATLFDHDNRPTLGLKFYENN